MILDTNAISSLLDGNRELSLLLNQSTKKYLPLVVIAEYLFGLRTSKLGTRLQALFQKLESESALLIPDRETADWYATIRHELKNIGKPIPHHDIWIAALARQHDLEIVSRDLHFDAVAGVRRLGW